MPSSYLSPPPSPTSGFFPTGSTSPNTLIGVQGQNPRDMHNMYSLFASLRGSKTSASQEGKPSLKRLFSL
ncbi:hypothetical protein JR316_0000512 [Psilocybe cubensis]|uniref:Uncharacterized protein n=2 Tax=Psilocybe cubensis TaxID=181762 RepID=A0A8H7YA34_PSICU|nr:hypothetical protein JR316_0000512 [Psilocybe cubensis]KAH9486447.1 hypothetical protein JR316_0000512 [Psilocybe cubensis]